MTEEREALWHDWAGGEQPVKDYVNVVVRYRSGGTTEMQASKLRWSHTGVSLWNDILAYMVPLYRKDDARPGVIHTSARDYEIIVQAFREAQAERDALQARVAELEASTVALPMGGAVVQVKPLEWKFFDVSHDYGRGVTEATTPFDHYSIWDCAAETFGSGNRFFCRRLSASFASLERAKAAAQADYDGRIRSALVTPPAIRALPINDEEGTA